MLFVSFFVFQACKEDDDFNIGSNFLESQTNVVLIDTFTVSLSTVVLDSFPTSSDSILLVGYFKDNNVGKISCSSYFQIGLPESTTLYDEDVYDSLTLRLSYSGYSYGDTNQVFKFSVHRITQQPEDDVEYLYNTSYLSYDETPLATFSFTPYPKGDNTLEIPIDDLLGKDFFDKLKNEDNNDDIDQIMSSNDYFIDYFNGIVLIPDTVSNNTILSFTAKEADLSLVMYINRYNDDSEEDLEIEFPITNNNLQFNRIIHDFSETGLANFTRQRYDISSSETGNKSYLFGGGGLLVKIKFPWMQELLNSQRGSILRTELILYPEENFKYEKNLPEEIVLYNTDKYNRFGDAILTSDGNYTQVADFYLDDYNENTSYTFNLTSFFISEFSDGYFDMDHGLLLSLPSTKYSTTFERLDVGAKSPSPKLKIYYVNY